MKVTVIGAGRIGFAVSGHLALTGHEVRLYEFPEFGHSIDELAGTRTLNVINVCPETGLPEGEAAIAYAGTDAEKALRGTDIVLVATPAFGEKKAAAVCAPWLNPEHQVIMLSGYIYGSVEFLKTIRERGNTSPVTVMEMNNSPYAARKIDGKTIRIGCYKRGVGVASFPGEKAAAAWEKCASLFPGVELWDNILLTGISNPSIGVHSTAVVFNPRYVEEKAEVFMYQNGKHLSAIGDAIGRVNMDMDGERLRLDGIFGPLKPWRHVFRDWYGYLGVRGESLLEIMSSNLGLAGGLLPASFDNRFLTEDVSMGIWPIIELLALNGFPGDVCGSVAVLAQSLSGIDLKGRARTLKSLGLAPSSVNQLKDYLYHGI